VGTIVVSGDKGGLLGRVTSLQAQGSELNLSLQPVPLWQAFRQLDINVSGAPVPVQISLQHGRMTLSSHGRRLRSLDLGPFGCKNSSGGSVDVTIEGPSITADVTAQLVATYKSTWTGGISQLELYVTTSVPITLTTGSATFNANGQETVTCSAEAPQIVLPGLLPLGPIDLVGPSISQSLDITLNANANATLTVVGPALTDTATLTDGIQYVNGTWQAIEQNTQTGPLLTPAGTSFSASASVDVKPAYRVDLGMVATLFGVPITTADVAFGEVGADFSLSLQAPISADQAGYTGPSWSANLDLQAGPELMLSGDLLEYLGAPAFSQQWAVFDDTIPLASSPTPTLSATPGVVQSGAVALTAFVPVDYAGDQVQFIGFLNGATIGAMLAQTAVSPGGTANASWTPAAGGAGTYAVIALLYDPIFNFGALRLPYASSPISVVVAPAATPSPSASPTARPTSSPSPSPSPSPSTMIPPGELYLSINDDIFGDNSGTWSVGVGLSPGAQHQVTYSGATEWMDSGVALSAGQTVTFSASGLIYIGNVSAGQPNISNYQSPAGDPNTSTAAQGGSFAAPGLVPWSLVGRIGSSGTPFEIGTGITVIVTSGN